jgi:hypothetical protein
MSGELPTNVIASIAFVGRSGGLVKNLAGFKKGHHTLPDSANGVTNAFLGKICETELADEAERLFQELRTGLGYRRKEIALTVSSPVAVLTAKDFALEILYVLQEREPSRFGVTTTLRDLRAADVARREEFARIFSGKFTEISFALKKSARVEAIIDAIEDLEGERGLSVVYPSNYHDCTIRVTGVDAEVRCTGASLEIVFPRGGAPAELIDAFAAVRDAFAMAKPLSGLIA